MKRIEPLKRANLKTRAALNAFIANESPAVKLLFALLADQIVFPDDTKADSELWNAKWIRP